MMNASRGHAAIALALLLQGGAATSLYFESTSAAYCLGASALVLTAFVAICLFPGRFGGAQAGLGGNAACIQSALDSCKTNVMIADAGYDIIYMNKTMLEMMRAAEADLRKDIPSLDSSKLIGASIDMFHKNPAHQRGILDGLTKTIETDIKVGGRDFHLVVTPVIQGRRRLGTVVEWQDRTEAKAMEEAAFRLRTALDSCKTNVMVADESYHIVYMNNTMLQMMQAAEADLRKDIPRLESRKLIGTNIDTFHKNPAHQRRILDALTKTVETDIRVGGRSFHLVVSPIVDKSGKRLGTTVEWKDETAEKAIEAELSGVVKAAVDGDLTRRVSPEGKQGFMLNLATMMNTLCDKVADFVSEIKTAAKEVSAASQEISVSTTDLSQRTEEQAASLEQTSASIEQISATVKKNAEHAEQANQSAGNTRQVADRGGQVVAQAVDAMARIEESSRKISDIISVIDEIARQTNLLALNAAVEAARAGEAGRGFAVVASEVRTLAQRSAQAAKDIKDLITDSNGRVKDGVDLVSRAGAALAEIVESIKSVAAVVSDIAHASAEQASGIEQVNTALSQMDEVTQQNSALVEQNAATARTLEHQAKTMDMRVAFFRLGDEPQQGGAKSELPTKRDGAGKPGVAGQPASPAPVRRGGAGRTQTAVVVALKEEQAPDQWKEF